MVSQVIQEQWVDQGLMVSLGKTVFQVHRDLQDPKDHVDRLGLLGPQDLLVRPVLPVSRVIKARLVQLVTKERLAVLETKVLLVRQDQLDNQVIMVLKDHQDQQDLMVTKDPPDQQVKRDCLETVVNQGSRVQLDLSEPLA